MKPSLLIAAACTLTLSSCQNVKWPWKKADAAADPYAAAGAYNAYPQQGATPNYAVPNYSTGGEQAQVYPATGTTGGAAPQPSYDTGTKDWHGGVTKPSKKSPGHASAGGAVGSGSYFVAKGDTLYSISRKSGSSVNKIMQANGLTTTNIRVGQKLRIP